MAHDSDEIVPQFNKTRPDCRKLDDNLWPIRVSLQVETLHTLAYGRDIVLDPYRSLIHRFITTKVIRSADVVLVDSEIHRKAALSLACMPQRLVSFPWVNLDDLVGITNDSSLRCKMGWDDKMIVVSVRRHESYLAVDTLIRAIPFVVAKSQNVRFLVFGRGTQTQRLLKLAQDLKIERYVYFAGWVPRKELLRCVKDCDIYVSTSLTDGTSSSL